MSPDFNYCTFLPRCTFLNLNAILFTSHSAKVMCGSNLCQSRGYKISAESLLHRVQSYGQRGFPRYRSHRLLCLFRHDPINHQSIDRSINREISSKSHLRQSWYAPSATYRGDFGTTTTTVSFLSRVPRGRLRWSFPHFVLSSSNQ